MTEETRTGKTASVDIVKSDEVLIAENEGKMVRTLDTEGEGADQVKTSHRRPGTLVMYKPTERQGYVPRTVSASAIRLLLNQGWKEVCPDCGQRHVNADGVESTDPNLCEARPPVKVRVCRVCRKRIYDNQGFLALKEDGDLDDPNVIDDEQYTRTSPEQRTLAALNLHYWTRHPREAQMMDLPPVPDALKSMVEGVRAAI
jgi:hypothetical protein